MRVVCTAIVRELVGSIVGCGQGGAGHLNRLRCNDHLSRMGGGGTTAGGMSVSGS
jgi:hypothetical protein